MPLAPTAVKMKPPTIAPTMPSTISRKNPSPDLLTILLAMNPEISPRIIQPIIDIAHLLTRIALLTLNNNKRHWFSADDKEARGGLGTTAGSARTLPGVSDIDSFTNFA